MLALHFEQNLSASILQVNKIHPTAIFEEGVQLGEGAEIGPYCRVGPRVIMGDRCVLKSHVVIEGRTVIGNENVFSPFCYIGGEPQDLKYHQEDTTLEIGSRNIIREGATIHRGTAGGGGKTQIGDHNLIMGYVHIAHDCHLGSHNVLSNYTGLSGHVIIDDHVILGGQNGVAQFLRIGSYVFTGGASLIDRNVPPYSTGYGNRFEVKGVNIVGLKRHGFSRESISEILEAHRLYYRAELKHDEALRVISETFGESPEIRLFLDFIRGVEGGSES